MDAGRTNGTNLDRRGAPVGAARGLARDERAGELMEWALIAGLVVVAAITLAGAAGADELARWNTLNAGQ